MVLVRCWSLWHEDFLDEPATQILAEHCLLTHLRVSPLSHFLHCRQLDAYALSGPCRLVMRTGSPPCLGQIVPCWARGSDVTLLLCKAVAEPRTAHRSVCLEADSCQHMPAASRTTDTREPLPRTPWQNYCGVGALASGRHCPQDSPASVHPPTCTSPFASSSCPHPAFSAAM